jgi:hypothetical protein
MANEIILGTERVVQISSAIGERCKHCAQQIGTDRFAESINHYIQEHNYRLLHVGQQTEDGSDGPWQTTVAVLGVLDQGSEYSMHIMGEGRS